MSYLTDAAAMDEIAALLKAAGKDDLLADAPYWETIVSRCNLAAYQEVLGSLLQRGFTRAQVDAWDRRVEFQRDLMVYWALTDGGALESFSDLFVRAKDRRKDLLTVQVFAGGVYVNPLAGVGGPGVCSYGASEGAAGGAVFNWPPSDGSVELGKPTKW